MSYVMPINQQKNPPANKVQEEKKLVQLFIN